MCASSPDIVQAGATWLADRKSPITTWRISVNIFVKLALGTLSRKAVLFVCPTLKEVKRGWGIYNCIAGSVLLFKRGTMVPLCLSWVYPLVYVGLLYCTVGYTFYIS